MLSRILLCLLALALGCDGDETAAADSDAADSDAAPRDATSQPDGALDLALPDAERDAELPPIERTPPPPDEGIYGYASGCYAVEGFDGARAIRHLAAGPSGEDFAFAAETLEAATRFHMRASDLGTYLFYDTERRYLAAEPQEEAWRFTRPATLESEVDRLEDGFRSPAEWHLQPSSRDPERYQLQHRATERFLTLTGLSEDEAGAAIITLQPREGCADFPELSIDAVGAVQPRRWEDGDAYGIAEIHSHMMADSGFGGGGAFHGAPFHRLGVERALPDCERSHGPEGRRDLAGFVYDGSHDFDAAALLPVAATGEFEEFNHLTAGYPDFPDWPRSWARATHQTMYYRWLERAWLAGLRVMVQNATGNSVLCELTTGTGAQRTLYGCNDMVSVDRAIAQAHALERYVDAQWGGPGKGWFRVVESPAQARAIINEGKLAVVLGIEISNLLDCFLTPPEGFERCTPESVEEKLDRYQALGVRLIFPVHKYDNAFSAGDGQGGVIEFGNFINSGHYSNFVEDCPNIDTAFDGGGISFGGLNRPREVYDAPAPVDMSGFAENLLPTLAPFINEITAPGIEGDFCQQHGLTPLGEGLLRSLMARGMLIDVSHLPKRSLERAYELLEEADYPPLKTHGNTNGGRVYRLGGLAGTGLGRCSDPNQPGAMGARLARDVAAAVVEGAYPAEGLSFDLNGFAGGPRPRFGEDSHCGAPQANPVTYPFTSYDGNITFQSPQLGNRAVDFNTEGMIHIGLLPELIEDVRRDGTSDEALEPLFRSAEAFLRLWEKAELRAAQ